VDLTATPRPFKPEEYEGVLKRWTRARQVIRAFDTIINVNVTYLSPEHTGAYAALYGKHYRLTQAEQRRFLAGRLAEVRSRHEFYMAVTTADPDWNDFDQDNSIWRITLWDDHGTRVKPLAIKKLTVTEVHRAYFPYTSVFHKVYHLVFPRQVGGKPFITTQSRYFKLVITSPRGAAELAWFVRRPTAPANAPRKPR
jgi:hypothetical protein